MGSDRARRSYDASRMYRSVISQQGRVTLEADDNEAEEIRADESRAELLDIVGPKGAPGNGFKIAVPVGLQPLDFAIGKGTLYLGGVRVHQDDDNATYFGQVTTEWVGGAPRPDRATKPPFTEAVYLAVTEQEVCAVEDEALREVALGGPDTAARTRLIQRVQRLPVRDPECEKAFAAVLGEVYAAGATFDSATMRLDSTIRLRVEPITDGAKTDDCQPSAQTGFLGSENQLIRVQVSGADTMLWGWDNASFMYRVDVTGSNTLKLRGMPVDVHHHPSVDKWVEILRTAVNLGGKAQMAEAAGVALQVEDYDSDSRTVKVKTAEDLQKTHSGTVFLRVWENQFTFVPDGTKPVALANADRTGTGLRVYVDTKGTLPVVGDYWTIGVRPSTPQSILPARLAQFQPPDGPKRWVTPLAVIAWRDLKTAEVTDCRPPFLNLVELTRRKAECCELLVSPEAHASKTLTLQDAINRVVKAGGGSICLQPGVYKLEQTLVVNDADSFRITGQGPTSHLLSPGVAIKVSKSDFVTLEAFRVQCVGIADKRIHAIEVGNSSRVRIERLRIDGDSGWAGIGLGGALEDVTIRENWIGGRLERTNLPLETVDEGIVDMTDADIRATGLADLRVEDNVLMCAKVGVRLANVSVHQGVSRFAGNSVSLCSDAGFQLQGVTVPGCAVEVIGNELAVPGVGILTGLDGIRIADNDLTPGRHTDSIGKNGIFMTKGSATDRVDDAQITGNRITRFGIAIKAEVPLGSVSIVGNQISTSGTGLEITSDPPVNLTINANQIANIAKTAIEINTKNDSKNGRITISDNHLQVTGKDPIVTVDCSIRVGDCLFCQNHCVAPEASIKTVNLTCRTLVVASNRVDGGVVLTCDKGTKVPPCTVLGNVSGLITINQIPLAKTHWDPLNVPSA